ncbi:MAG TPA: septal ring lytic transglycosylase RlpA family protein [Xanthobacteraceae bacterium]|nr:septal ring lytic transglycosylase RlpA family protein [Xanthobacteraceae bacterium]
MGQVHTSTRISRRATAQLVLAAALSLLTANCNVGPISRMVDPVYGVPASPRVVEEGQVVPKGGGVYRVGNTYTVAGRTYTPEVDPDYRAEGIASWYGRDFHGRRTANGEIFDMDSLTAAHPTLPIPSYVRVTNLSNRRSVIVRINDRGPFKDNRLIDLSKKSADVLGFRGNGLARVRVEYVGRASLDGSDDRKLMATLRHDGQPAPAPSNVMLAATGGPFVPAMPEAVPARRVADVPTPSIRPFELGRYPTGTGPSIEPTQVATISAPQPRAAFGAGNAPRFIPASAMSPSVSSGRGLY